MSHAKRKSPSRRAAKNHARSRQVEVIPAYKLGGVLQPPVYGTIKTVCGARVVEVSPTYYQSLDLTRCAERYYRADGHSFSGWIVREVDTHGSCLDPISTKSEALEALADDAAWRAGKAECRRLGL